MIEQTLHSWQPTVSITSNTAAADNISRASELYRLTCLLCIKKLLSPDLNCNSLAIREIVSTFVLHLEQIPPDSPVNTILTWPLVVMGCDAVIATHRRIISARVHASSENIKSANIELSLKFLRHTWKMQPEYGSEVGAGEVTSFADLMNESQMSVILV